MVSGVERYGRAQGIRRRNLRRKTAADGWRVRLEVERYAGVWWDVPREASACLAGILQFALP